MSRNSTDPRRADVDEQVLVVADDGENRRLLVEWLAGADTIEVADPGDEIGAAFDLCVVDPAGLRESRSAIAARKADAYPAFLPCLLVVTETTGVHEWIRSHQGEAAGDVVDEVITVPTRTTEFRRRVEGLLHARRLSLELGERTQQYRWLVGMAPEAICLVVDGEVRYLNQQARGMFGVDDATDVDRPFLDFFEARERGPVADLVARLEAGEDVDEFVECTVRAGGEPVPVEVTGVGVSYGGVDAVQVLVRDLTDRSLRIERLRLYGRPVDEASRGICITDHSAEGEPTIYVNDAFERATGYSAAAALGRNPRMLQGEDTDPCAVQRLRAAIEAGEPVTETVRNYRRNGEPFWNELTLAPVRDENGTVTHYLGFLRDVTDRVDRERHLVAIHEATRELMAAATAAEVCAIAVETADEVLGLPAVGIFLYDDDRGVLEAEVGTESAIELFDGLPTFQPGEGIAWQVFERGEALVVDDVRDHEEVYNPDTPVRSELLVPLGEHGVFVSGATDEHAFDDTDVRFARTLMMNVEAALDGAERERVLRERKRDLERYETVVRTAGEPIATTDGEGTFTDVNPAMETLTGYGREELVGSHASMLLDVEGIARLTAAFERLAEGDASDETIEFELLTAGGDRRRCVVNLALVRTDGQYETVAVIRDVTDQRRREQRLSVMDRVLRHNLRNEMNVVRGRATMLEAAVEGDDREHVEEITRAAEGMLSLSENARRFHQAVTARSRTPRPVDLVAVVEGLLPGFRERFPAATIGTTTPERAWALADETIRTAVNELIENALVYNDRAEPTVEITVTVDDATVEFAVADDGPGLPDSERRTFEGEAESALEHASGLGLWLVNWIVEDVGGTATCEDNHPRGTVMRVRLPRADPP